MSFYVGSEQGIHNVTTNRTCYVSERKWQFVEGLSIEACILDSVLA